MAIDLVCGKEVDRSAVNAGVGSTPAGAPETDPAAGTKRFYEGTWYYFCSIACRHKFVATPDEYIERAAR